MKVLIGAFAHESNDFCPGFTTREMFEFYEGQDVLDHLGRLKSSQRTYRLPP